MTRLRIGTRGSDLALWQTRWVSQKLREAHPSLEFEEVVIQTHGDLAVEQHFDADWPVGGFVGAIEQALAAGRIDLAVHSYKDLQTAESPGLTIAAIPPREVVHDVLVTRTSVSLDELPPGFRIGTSSPRRSAQLRRVADVEIVPMRGNVPTRIAKLERDKLDAVVLAAAGVKRLDINPPHRIDLPVETFVPAPAQGALAIQTRQNDPAAETARVLDHAETRRTVETERAFLSAISAGCHTPVGALASASGSKLSLYVQLFSDDGTRMVEGTEIGDDPYDIGRQLAVRLLGELGNRS